MRSLQVTSGLLAVVRSFFAAGEKGWAGSRTSIHTEEAG
jgi:hypothetical protein